MLDERAPLPPAPGADEQVDEDPEATERVVFMEGDAAQFDSDALDSSISRGRPSGGKKSLLVLVDKHKAEWSRFGDFEQQGRTVIIQMRPAIDKESQLRARLKEATDQLAQCRRALDHGGRGECAAVSSGHPADSDAI